MSDGGELTFRDAFSSDKLAGDEDFESDSDGSSTASVPAADAATAPSSDVSPEDRVQAALASGEWQKVKDPSSGKFYFYNIKTRKTTWDLAKELAPAKPKPEAAGPPPVTASLGGTPTDFTTGLPRLDIGGSFAASSAADGPGPARTNTMMPNARDSLAESLPMPKDDGDARVKEDDASRRQSKQSRQSGQSGVSDEFEDDATAQEKIVMRGGRVPIASTFASEKDLFNSVSNFRAFASDSDNGSAAQTEELPNSTPTQSAKVTPREAKKTEERKPSQPDAAAAKPTGAAKPAEAAAAAKSGPTPEPKPSTRPSVLDSDSSDFSTASQHAARIRAEQEAAAQKRTEAGVPALTLDRKPSPVSATASGPGQPTSSLPPYRPPLPSGAQAPGVAGGAATVTASLGAPDAGRAALGPSPIGGLSVLSPTVPSPGVLPVAAGSGGKTSPLGIPPLAQSGAVSPEVLTALIAQQQQLLLAQQQQQQQQLPSSQLTGNPAEAAPASVGAQPPPTSAGQDLRASTEALESLVRAYADLRGHHMQQQLPSMGDRREAALTAALAQALEEDQADAEPMDDGSRAGVRRERDSARSRVARALRQQQSQQRVGGRRPVWGQATVTAPRPRRGVSTSAAVASDQLEDTILDVVLQLFMERGRGAESVPALHRAAVHADPDEMLRVPASETAGSAVAGIPALSPFAAASLTTPQDFAAEGTVQDVVYAALDKYVINVARDTQRRGTRAYAHSVAAASRMVLLDASAAVQQIANAALGRSAPRDPLPSAAALLDVRFLPGADEALHRIITNVVRCLPVEPISAQQPATEAHPRTSQQVRFEYWVSVAHLHDIIATLTRAAREIEVVAADRYHAFQQDPASADDDAAIAIALPDAPVVTARILDAGAFSPVDSQRRCDQTHRETASDGPKAWELQPHLLDEDAAEQLFFAVGRLADEVQASMPAHDGTSKGPWSTEARASKARRVAVESAVVQTVDALLEDDAIRAAVTRKARSGATEAVERDPNVAMVDAMQDKVNRLVQRLKYQLGAQDGTDSGAPLEDAPAEES